GAIRRALDRSGIALGAIDLFEINEAFAAVALASMADLGIGDDVCNVNGGAIALGHPIGMSGTRVALTIAYELRRRGGGLGAAAGGAPAGGRGTAGVRGGVAVAGAGRPPRSRRGRGGRAVAAGRGHWRRGFRNGVGGGRTRVPSGPSHLRLQAK